MARQQHVAPVAEASDLKPRTPIRRFDVFAEYKRLEAERRGATPEAAQGYGVWVAKIVAGRRYGRSHSGAGTAHPSSDHGGSPNASDRSEWAPHELNGEPQTADTFEREIVRRMGVPFYERIFAPALRRAFEAGERYEDVRDRIRSSWKP